MRFRPASPEFKDALELICPNEHALDIPDWLKIVSKQINIDYVRLSRLWRDNRAKIHRYEEKWIEERLNASTLREINKSKKTINEAIATLGPENAHSINELVELLRRLDRAGINLGR
jgi:hypothetical protein